MKDLIVLVVVSLAIGFTIGGLKASGPPAAAPELPAPPLPRPGVYTVAEKSTDSAPKSDDWILTECGPQCLRVRSTTSDNEWQMDLPWNSTADRHRGAWVGERVNPGMRCQDGTPDGHQTGPVPLKYVIRADLTGFVNMKFSPENPSCSGETAMRGREFALRRAKAVWS
ncbi:hypothetical protein M2272_001611 [Mycobacterium frederiksbergense]|uniref:Serine/threonine protein kinase n=1 Tax=Mycolicibacterium frederiksbergense TaxID=117567 RepID=A0ABT6KW97_9MYCO|nr:hypothetical protein [Mycolicibacterium frederiksbergense]MDH6194982.1 hypothetical protein [Mycolicibacterium frederiksbergense]